MLTELNRRLFGALVAAGLSLAAGLPAVAQDEFITVASTTSTEQSGLFDYLLPLFKAKTGLDVHVVAQGTGQAIETGRRGDADVLFVHDTKSEEKFVADGFAKKRYDVMYNDFVIVGPAADPAGVKGLKDAETALKKIAAAKAPFASRGDDSGTHKAEQRLWQMAEVDVTSAGTGGWYRSTGSGMGPTLNTSAAMDAYALTDRGTWLNFRNRGNLTILVEGDKRLFNQYGVMAVNPAKHPHVKLEDGALFVNWLLSKEGQDAIAGYKINGEQLFFPNAEKSGS
ncbi:tungstate transport system substrate-binding protein [Skermanella aerolata]|uniref:Tungsten ABC transporter substrate-binding protein n=1 Tax=Skermanella aerolata TaxID=393310 RepID=A0A512DK37_9PROT|nr:substrate-binding domain-containing protein [Skermanella aerolata]GEO36837.1 tungsten ABC transporter substrate-binding protein [Skermanella aerolata]